MEDDDFEQTLERFVQKNGLAKLKHALARGDFVNGQEVRAQTFVQQKEKAAQAAYLMSPEYAAIRQAAAAEKANRIAIGSLIVSALAFVVAAVAMALQLSAK